MSEPELHADGSERRGDPETRKIFVEAYGLIEEHLDESGRWLSFANEQLAYGTLHQRYPDMDSQQIYVIVAAAGRIRSSGGKPAPA
jgi:hypothetical protein